MNMEKIQLNQKKIQRKINKLSVLRKAFTIIDRKTEPAQTLHLFRSVCCFIPLPKPDFNSYIRKSATVFTEVSKVICISLNF